MMIAESYEAYSPPLYIVCHRPIPSICFVSEDSQIQDFMQVTDLPGGATSTIWIPDPANIFLWLGMESS